MKRALVNNCGLFFTGYNAGVTAELCRQLGPDYFDAHFCSSGSVFGSTYCVAGQPDEMETIWREHVCDGQLVHLKKHFQGRTILDLDYLIEVFQRPDVRLDLDKLFSARSRVFYSMTDSSTGQSISAGPERQDIWDLMRASCAVPYLYHPVETRYGTMVDGGFSDACPVRLALASGYTEVVVVYNIPLHHQYGQLETILDKLVAQILPQPLKRLHLQAKSKRLKVERELFDHRRVRVIRPQTPLPTRSWLDGDKRRLNATIDRGITDACRYVQEYIS